MRISDPTIMQVGTVFYECEYGMNLKMKVTTKPVFENNQWKWKAEDHMGNEVDYLLTKGFEHYGPRIYSEPAYKSEIK